MYRFIRLTTSIRSTRFTRSTRSTISTRFIQITGITGIQQVLNNCSFWSGCEYVITALGGLKEYNDFNNVTLAHEDGTQVRQTKSSSHYPVQNWYKSQTKKNLDVNIKFYRKWKYNGVTESAIIVCIWPKKALAFYLFTNLFNGRAVCDSLCGLR